MLKLLKNFAIQHFTEEKFLDITIDYKDGTSGSYATKDAPVGIKFLDNFANDMELWIVKEDGEYVIKEACSCPSRNEKEDLDKLSHIFDSEELLKKTEKVHKNYLLIIDEEDFSHLSSEDIFFIVEAFKDRINQEIKWHELEIKRMRQGYSFLRKLQGYNI